MFKTLSQKLVVAGLVMQVHKPALALQRYTHRLIALAVLLLTVGVLQAAALAQDLQKIPPLTERVTDLTGTLSAADTSKLIAQLKVIEEKKGSQVAILLVPTTLPEDIASYSIRVVEAWKLGRKQVQGKAVDDGVLILLAKNDRKMRIEVGYGLEGAIPDSRAKRIIAETMAPRFRQGDFAGGLSAAVADVARLIEGEPLPDPWLGSTKQSPTGDQTNQGAAPASLIDWLPLVGICLFAGFVVTGIFGRWLGSVLSGVGSGFFLASATASLPLAAGVGGALFLLFLIFGGSRRRVNRVGRHTYGSSPVVIPGGGWGGGGWGGGSGGGGFSGGGGGFGGGGASGDW